MYIVLFCILVVCNSNIHCQVNKGVSVLETNPVLKRFGYLYGQLLRKGLDSLDQITLSDEKASFKEDKWVGEFTLHRGFMGVDLNINYLENETRVEGLSPLPEGAIRGWLVFYKYLIPKVIIKYKFTQTIKFIGSITGRFDIAINNLIAEVKLEASLPNVGRCVFGDRGMDVTFKVRDYKVEFEVEGGWVVGKTVSYVGSKIINSFIKGTLLRTSKKAVTEKFNDIVGSSRKEAGDDFHNKMESALCSLMQHVIRENVQYV